MANKAISEALNRTVYGSGVALKNIAAELDMSSSELSRRVSENGSIYFPLEKLPRLMAVTGDYSILDVIAEHAGREVKMKEVSPTQLVEDVKALIEALPGKLGEAMEAIQNGGSK